MNVSKQSMSEKRSNRSGTSLVRKRSSTSSAKSKRLSQISEEDMDSTSLVRPIMEEILEKALAEIHKLYMERQSIKFVVHCAHQALDRFIRFYFYQHNEYTREPPSWTPDTTISPSPPDSWAQGLMPLYSDFPLERSMNTLSEIKLEIEKKKAAEEVDSQKEVVSEHSESLLEDVRGFLDDIINELPEEEEGTSKESESVISDFTCIVEGWKHYDQYKMRTQPSRLALGSSTMLKLPKINLGEHDNLKRPSCEAYLQPGEKLPPIRTEARVKYHHRNETTSRAEPARKASSKK